MEMVRTLAVELNIPMALAEQIFVKGFHTPEGILSVEPAYFQSQVELSDVLVQDVYARARAVVDAKGE